MRKEVSIPFRIAYMKRHEKGESLKSIATQENISYSSLKLWWRRYKKQGVKGLQLQYHNCGKWKKEHSSFSPLIIRSIRWLKYKHRAWGAQYILTILEERYPTLTKPKERTVQTWFIKWDLTTERPKKYSILSHHKLPKVTYCHQRWQVDAKEQIRLRDATDACYLTVIDVFSGAILAAVVFSLCSY